MESTFLQPSEVHAAGLDAHFATPCFYANDKYHHAARQETPEFQGAGSIQTTPSDYLKFIAAMLKLDRPPVTKSIYDQVIKPRVIRNGKGSLENFGPDSSDIAYALGWDINIAPVNRSSPTTVSSLALARACFSYPVIPSVQ
jgi:hypothetical protein